MSRFRLLLLALFVGGLSCHVPPSGSPDHANEGIVRLRGRVRDHDGSPWTEPLSADLEFDWIDSKGRWRSDSESAELALGTDGTFELELDLRVPAEVRIEGLSLSRPGFWHPSRTWAEFAWTTEGEEVRVAWVPFEAFLVTGDRGSFAVDSTLRVVPFLAEVVVDPPPPPGSRLDCAPLASRPFHGPIPGPPGAAWPKGDTSVRVYSEGSNHDWWVALLTEDHSCLALARTVPGGRVHLQWRPVHTITLPLPRGPSHWDTQALLLAAPSVLPEQRSDAIWCALPPGVEESRSVRHDHGGTVDLFHRTKFAAGWFSPKLDRRQVPPGDYLLELWDRRPEDEPDAPRRLLQVLPLRITGDVDLERGEDGVVRVVEPGGGS